MKVIVAGVVLLLAATGCVQSSAVEGSPATLRLGYFSNVTHAPALVGVERGLFREHLGGGVALQTATFNAGGQAVEALFSGAIDLAYVGPNPAINAYAQSGGEAVRVIAGSTSGGAFLVVRPGLDSAEDLRGATLSTPALGNTQDVALRAWLADNELETDADGGGEVSVIPQENAQILETFREGGIDGAWVPEPWATRMAEAGGVVLVDERDLWPQGRYATTVVVARTAYLESHRDLVVRFLRGHRAAVEYVIANPREAQSSVLAAIESTTGVSLPAATMARAWGNLEFTLDPVATSLQAAADDAADLGLLGPVDLAGLYHLSLLGDESS